MQNGIVHVPGSALARLSLPKQLMKFLSETYGIHVSFLSLENQIVKTMDHIKQIKLYPPHHGVCDIIVVYEAEDVKALCESSICVMDAQWIDGAKTTYTRCSVI